MKGRIRGSLLGCLLGDGFGRPLEGASAGDARLRIWAEKRRHGSDPLGYSDDAEMMMLVAESIVARGGIDPAHLHSHLARHHDPARGYGKGTRAALAGGGQLWPEGSQGNGAAVRVTPIACWYRDNPMALDQAAAASARITHAHPAAVDGAVVMARATALLLQATAVPGDFLSRLKPNDPALRWKLATLPDLLAARVRPVEAAALLGNGVRAVDSVPLALFSFLRAAREETASFEELIVEAALAGGDVDTILAMTGALAGALIGEEHLPRRWLARAEGRARVDSLADQLFRR